jgi:hypothetical protein
MPIQTLISRASNRRPSELQDVHFHRGPQGHPMPCYEGVCQIPRMASEDVREAANAARK